MRALRDERGFSITEVLVAMTIAAVVFGAAVYGFSSFVKQQAATDRRTISQDQARTATDRIARELRSAASSGVAGTQAIELQSDFDLVFLAPTVGASLTGNSRGLSHIRFCVDSANPSDGRLWRQVSPFRSGLAPSPPATTGCPNGTWAQSEVIARNLVNQLGPSTVPLFSATTDSTGLIGEVSVRPRADADPGTGKAPTELLTKVSLRNANRKPTASLTCQGLANGHGVCDASASVDPDGELLLYSWTMDGAPLADVAYRVDQASLASRSTHTFAVTVKDSGGLVDTATQAVTIP